MKQIRILALAAAAVSLLLVAPVAQAQQPQFMPGYLSLSGGVYVPEGSDLDDNNADTGMAFFLNSGFMINPFVGLQCDIGYFETSGDNSLKVSAFPIDLSVKIAVPIAFVEPYVIGGGGVYFTTTELDVIGLSVDENNTEFAPHAGLGVNFNFGRFQFGFESRYIWLSAGDLDVDGMLLLGKLGTRF